MVGQVELSQLGAALQRPCTYAADVLGQSQRGQRGAVHEGLVGQSSQTREVIQFLECLDGRALEHGADVLHIGRLAVGQLAVAVAVEVVETELLHSSIGKRHGLLAIVLRLNAHDDFAIAVIAVVRAADALLSGRQLGQQVVAVARAAPAPVDMVLQVAVVAVGHKGVTSLIIRTADVDGTSGGNLGVDNAVPLRVAGHRLVADVAHR